MTRIFVSHSRRDTDIVSFFTAAFATSKKGVKADLMEFEDLETKYAGHEISRRIKNPETQAAFVLLGPGVPQFQHTENWVTFEVGVASGAGKDVWVFEPLVDNVEFPIPFLNHYVLYQVGNKDYLRFIREVIDWYDTIPLFRNPLSSRPRSIKCDHCKAQYYLHTHIGQFPCPCCRNRLSFVQPIR